MSHSRHVAVMIEISWNYKRHSETFVGTQQYAGEQGWDTTIDEYADATLPTSKASKLPYDGVIARATRKLAGRARRLNVPVVNVWASCS